MNVTPTIQKIILTILILSALGFVVYSTIFGEIEVALDGDGVPVATNVIGQEVLILADKLESIEIKKSIFSSPLFTNLIDISTPLIDEEQGRENPFSKIGTESTSVTVTRP